MDLSRREFMVVGVAGLGSDTTLQTNPQLSGDPSTGTEFQGVAHLLGPLDARPAPGSQFFNDKAIYAYIYETPTGNRYFKRQSDNNWSLLVPPQDNSSASLDLDTEGTVTGSGDGPTLITLPTTLSVPRLFDSPSDGVVRYIGDEQVVLLIIATLSVSGANTTFEAGIAVNGLPAESRTEVQASTSGSNKPESVTLHGKLTLQPDDEIALSLENIGGTTDLTVEQLSLSI